jgi:UDPglucose 6-dehydrogenase
LRISIFGSGQVGLVQAAVFSQVGHQITCMDIDPARIERIQGGDLPFYEPGLNELLQAGIAQNMLCFNDDTAEAVEASDYLFICVGTSAAADGTGNL